MFAHAAVHQGQISRTLTRSLGLQLFGHERSNKRSLRRLARNILLSFSSFIFFVCCILFGIFMLTLSQIFGHTQAETTQRNRVLEEVRRRALASSIGTPSPYSLLLIYIFSSLSSPPTLVSYLSSSFTFLFPPISF